ncbi:MAG: L-threonylcarbamoyladenylate synthase, partial [Flavicella sp.]
QNRKGTILYPTDTVWGLGCDATDSDAVASIYKIKNRIASKSLIILVASIDMLQQIIPEIPKVALELVANATKPTTIIYKNPKGLAPNVVAEDNTVAIRIPDDVFCKKLIREFGKPIVSTSANVSGEPTPQTFSEISTAILDSVDYIVNLHHDKINDKSSTILRITDTDEIEVIRA